RWIWPSRISFALGSVLFRSLFFSSRRRHTRWPRDWSSDVCSSDLTDIHLLAQQLVPQNSEAQVAGREDEYPCGGRSHACQAAAQIGRASCRERGEMSVVFVS